MAGTTSKLPRIRACIFDMDGLLIDSEDLYTEVTNAILAKYGRPNLPWSIKAQLQGRPGPQSNEIFRKWAQLPCTQEEFTIEQKALQARLFPTTKPLPGVLTLLATLRDVAQVDMALATSSHAGNFALKSSHLPQLFGEYFDPAKGVARVLGDDPRVAQGRGKPRGDIYLLALDLLNAERRKRGDQGPDVTPDECLVFEDSVPGAEAGRRAGMRVCWAPHSGLEQEYRGREAEVLAGRTGESGIPDEKDEAALKGLKGWPSAVGDGWGIQVKNLEDFPYEKFGIVLPS